MQSITTFKNLNLKPTIVVSHETLQAIKYIVSLAPQEAQWFHTVEPIEYKSSPGEIFLHLSTKLYIPKQNTSAAQVDSTSSMMIEFYQELKEEYKDQQLVNEKLNSMTCWCHSHHNMNPSPSNQDDLQFNSFINSAIDQNQSSWQIMLIFNKKDQFYSRVWDPATGLIFEGVNIQISTPYDFSYISKAAKEKFLKRTYINKYSKGNKFFNKSKNKNYDALNFLDDFNSGIPLSITDTLNDDVACDLLDRIYSKTYPDSSTWHLKPVKSSHLPSNQIYQELIHFLDDQEALWFSFIVDGKVDKLKNIYSENQVDNYMSRYASKVDERILTYLTNTSDTISCFHKKLSFLFSLTDSTNKADFLQLIQTSNI